MSKPQGVQAWSDTDIFRIVESVCQDDTVVNVWDVHAIMIAMRDDLERQLASGAMTPERIEAIDYARDLLAHEVREFKDASGREPRYLATLNELLAGLGWDSLSEADGGSDDNS